MSVGPCSQIGMPHWNSVVFHSPLRDLDSDQIIESVALHNLSAAQPISTCPCLRSQRPINVGLFIVFWDIKSLNATS